MCCPMLGLTSLVFVFYNPMIFLPNQLNNQFNNQQIIIRIQMAMLTFHLS
jgi:hypothetical protein